MAEVRFNQSLPLTSGGWVDANQLRSFSYDKLNRLVTSLDAEDQPEGPGNPARPSTFSYDKVGNLLAEIDPNGNRVEHAYDERNRRISTSQSSQSR